MESVDVTLPIDFFQSESAAEVFEYLETEDKVKVLLSLGVEKSELKDVPADEYVNLLERFA